MKNKRCIKCGKLKPVEEYYRNQHYCKSCQKTYNEKWREGLTPEKRAWYKRTEDKIGQMRRRSERRQNLRREMLAEYGGKCTCCGEANFIFLTLEHLNGGGNKHRRQFKKAHGTWADLKRQGWPKEGFTILCWNCQMAKTHYGKCPHNSN